MDNTLTPTVALVQFIYRIIQQSYLFTVIRVVYFSYMHIVALSSRHAQRSCGLNYRIKSGEILDNYYSRTTRRRHTP